MNPLSDLSDDNFVPFLHGLGTETYKKSFEWMLHDREFSGVLRWMFNNLDQNNALNAREECRYIELEKKGQLLNPKDLEATIANIQEEYQGICLPGDQNAFEDAKMEVNMLKERLSLLEKQETVLKDLEKQNELAKMELNLEITKLNSSYQQSIEDQQSAADECILLAQEVEEITEGVTNVVADTLELYGSVHSDKDNARKFFTFGPFESYRQSQALFRSHFDLYSSKKFAKKSDYISDEELRSTLIEAKGLEDRLSDAIYAYTESNAELAGEQAKLALVTSYKNVHPSQITSCMVEAQSALELLEQEESILNLQLQTAVRQLVEGRTNLAVETTAKSALAMREQIHSDISHLLDTTQKAYSLDRVLYVALRHELWTVEEFLEFAAHVRRHVLAETDAVQARIDSMNEICSEQEMCAQKLRTSDLFLHTLHRILGAQPSNDSGLILVSLYGDLQSSMNDIKDRVSEGYRRKEDALIEMQASSKPIRDFIWDGCTKQPNCRNRAVASLTHSLRQKMEEVDRRVVDVSSLFTQVKSGDKQSLRKLWQWFLTDPRRLLSALKQAQSNSYS